ncbi:MAG TPA: hypothetical protein VK821_14695 [Dehalococcoidia bacterium]|nr:hypothetical protein [Dehalococcoidia bacterium]
MSATASSGPLQTTEEIAHIRQQMEAELDAQRARRTQSATTEL